MNIDSLRNLYRCLWRPALLSAGLLWGVAAPLSGFAQVNAEQVMTIGRNVLSMEDYLLAIQYFNMAIKAKPYLSDAYYLRGLAKLQLDDYEGAIADCTLAIDRNKFKTEAYKVRGFARQRLGLDSLAIEDYNHGLDYNPDDRYFMYYKGIAETELKRYNAADSTLSRLLRRYPKFDEGYIARGRNNILAGDTIKGMADIDRSMSISKTNIGAHLIKAEILAKQGDWTAASEAMDEAVRLRPEETDLYINRAYIRYNKNDFFGAMSDYDYALTLDPKNEVALFNRALLRTEVKALSQASQDFTEVLRLDPTNFHALYNRGLIYLEIGQYRKAYDDFKEIARRYPRFHPAYYAMAECQRNLGNMREMLATIKKADQLVTNYVANPSRNPLDRPTIQAGKTHTGNKHNSKEANEEEFMEKFNQLVTSSTASEPQLAFNDKIKGRVQDRDISVMPEEEFTLSFNPPEISLRNLSNNFRNLDQLNRRQYISRKIYLRQGNPTPSDPDLLSRIFTIEDGFTKDIIASDNPRPIDMFGRGVARIMLKNYDGAIADLTRAIEGSDDFTTALFARAYAYGAKAGTNISGDENHDGDTGGAESVRLKRQYNIERSMEDLDALLAIDPTMLYAWFNKGCLYYNSGDFTSAINAYDRALELDPEFGQAYFNRGLAFIRQGNREKAFADLSKAGELGVLQSYNILKRLK